MIFKIANLVIGLALALPVFASAQEGGTPITREQVRAELVALEKAGYSPSRGSVYYPADIQAAEAKIHAGTVAGGNTQASYGEVISGTSQCGNRGDVAPADSEPYLHH
ncbi:DUF4148 domain-containing protein [Paraburkholderia sp. RL17-347-BIC-D]|uniref:DUF4148 domain-containing protein n=1 Tax=Paraburkholderia sp. RL17-347-BIC-D TaxID=3031632 RepID=UPI0038BB2063